MNWNKKNLAFAIIFFILDILCLFSLLHGGISVSFLRKNTYLITGLVIFTIVGIGFLKKARK